MKIENKWVVCDEKDGMYYIGDDDRGEPVMENLNSRVRVYKNEKGAKGAIRHIQYSGSERAKFLVLKAVHIANESVPDVPEDVKDKPTDNLSDKPESPKFTEVKDRDGWQEVYGFAFPMENLVALRNLDSHIRASKKLGEMKYCKSTVGVGDFGAIKLCRKAVGDREMFGVIAADGKLYSAGLGGGAAALEKFCDECRNYLLPRVTRGDNKEELVCPICGAKSPHFVRLCPKHRKDICEKHCNEGCEYFSGYDTSIVQCYFSRKQETGK